MISITQNGKPIDKSKYILDLENKTFSSKENYLVLDFSMKTGWTFDTGSGCTFDTGSDCTFKTGYSCTFNTGSDCTFDTAYGCTFNTDSDCTFKTGTHCIFKTGYDCTFKTGSFCTFKTGSFCTFDTGSDCTLLTYKPSRHFLDDSNYVLIGKGNLMEIKDKNMAILNIKNEDSLVRQVCKSMLKRK